ncbi:MAG: VWA domain-containing protein [Vicinamibacterales bacterium]
MKDGRARASLALLIGSVLLAMPVTDASQDPPRVTFRSGASAVVVDVTVQNRSRRPITGLTATDFEVFDNGVLQHVDEVSYGKLPIDVTVGLDVSYSVTGAVLDRLRVGVGQLMRDLGPQDRLKLVLFNTQVSRATDFTTDAKVVERAIRGAVAGGGTALLDAVSVTLVSSAPLDRRQLVVFFTDGTDSSSISGPDTVTAVAQRTRATITFVVPMADGPVIFPRATTASPVPTPIPVNRLAAPTPVPAIISRLASETGGGILTVGTGSNLSSIFQRILNEFRSAYVLYYTARDVDRSGYHTIQVKVKRDGAQVQARRGYFASYFARAHSRRHLSVASPATGTSGTRPGLPSARP